MTSERAAWAAYWASAGDSACLPALPQPMRESLVAVWRDTAAALPEGAQVLDVASGGGAVIRALRDVRAGLDIVGVDYAAVGPTAARLGVRGGVDAEALPFAAGSFDAVVSQFGLEYCRDVAWVEAARVLRAGGRLTILCHHAGSRLVNHNRARLAAMRGLEGAGLFTLAGDLAKGGVEDSERSGAVAAVRRANAGQSIVEELPAALGQALRGRSAGLAVAAITQRASGEMTRLAAMSSAALDADEVARRCALLATAGVEVSPRPLLVDAEPIAWVVADG